MAEKKSKKQDKKVEPEKPKEEELAEESKSPEDEKELDEKKSGAGENKVSESDDKAKVSDDLKSEEDKSEVKVADGEKDAGSGDKKEESKSDVSGETTAEKEAETAESSEKKAKFEDEDGDEKKAKPKRFRLPFFSKDKSGKEEDAEDVEKKDVSPNEAVNKLDPENKVAYQETVESLAEDIDEQIEDATEDDFMTLKIHKKKLVVVLGVAVILMWIVPMYQLIKQVVSEQSSTVEEVAEEKVEDVVEEKAEVVVKIRIKYLEDNKELAASAAGVLKAGGFNQIEVTEDTESEYKKLLITAKTGGDDLKKKIKELLQGGFVFNEDNKDLTVSDDSELDAVIFVGEGSVN